MATKAPERPKPRAKPKVDPRIEERRAEVQREQTRRRHRRLLQVVIAFAVITGLWWLTLTPLLDVDAIHVRGAAHTGEQAVLAASGIERGDALLTAHVGGAARALAKLPWIERASVRRSWPGTIDITVVERTPVAAIASKTGGWVVVDRDGRELAVEKEPSTDLVRVAGRKMTPALSHDAPPVFDVALRLAAAIPPSLRPTIGALWPQQDGTLEASVTLPDGHSAVAHLGGADQIEAKLVALAAVLERADLARVRFIDLRVPDAPALTRG